MESGFLGGRAWVLLFASVVSACGVSQGRPKTAPASGKALSAEEGRALQTPPDERARFAWPVSHAVPVREFLSKDGRKSEVAYAVRICPAAEGRFRIEHVDFEIVSVDGLKDGDPGVVELEKTILRANPAFVVDSTGLLVDVQGFGDMLGALSPTLGAERLALLRRTFSTEQSRAVLKEAVASRWRLWVEAWLLYDPALGPDLEIESKVLGTQQTWFLSFEGWNGSRAKLSWGSRMSKEIVRVLLGAIAEPLGIKDFKPEDVEEANIEQSGAVETDWPDLRPHIVTLRKAISATVRGRMFQNEELREYRFDWASAKAVTCPPARQN